MISVALTPRDLRPAPTIVVVDALRATSTITRALEAGYAQVLCFDSLDRALAHARPGRLLAGERACLPPPGFDEGNSPSAFTRRRADDVGLCTTNGTPLLVRAAGLGARVVAGCLLNLDAVAAAVSGDDVLVACAGTAGEPAIEDVLVAGLLVERLGSPSGDPALLAAATARGLGDTVAALRSGRSAANLLAAGLSDDIPACAEVSVTECVPEIHAVSRGVAAARPSAVLAGAAPPQLVL